MANKCLKFQAHNKFYKLDTLKNWSACFKVNPNKNDTNIP